MYVIFGCKYIAPHNNYAQLHKLVCCIRIRITTDHRNKSEHASCTLASHVLHMHWTLWDTILLHGKLWSIHGSPFLFPGLKSFDEDKGMPFIRPFIPPPHTPPPPTPFSECWEECSIFYIKKHCLHNAILHWTRENKKKPQIGTQKG